MRRWLQDRRRLVITVGVGLAVVGWFAWVGWQRVDRGVPSAVLEESVGPQGTLSDEAAAREASIDRFPSGAEITGTTVRRITFATLVREWLGSEPPPEARRASDDAPVWLVGITAEALTVRDIRPDPGGAAEGGSDPGWRRPVHGAFYAWLAEDGDLLAEGLIEDPSEPDADFTIERLRNLPEIPTPR